MIQPNAFPRLKFALVLAALPAALASCATPRPEGGAVARESDPQRELASGPGGLLNFPNVIDIAPARGQTFLSFMITQVKPALDRVATEGYRVAPGRVVVQNLGNVFPKVSRKVLASAGTAANVGQIADRLSSSGQTYSLYTLPNAISGVRDKYGFATYLGLSSGGGVAVRIDNRNIAYNIHYGTGKERTDPQTGRSFGESLPSGVKANDASDKHYLGELEKYVRTQPENLPEFFRVILNVLTNSDVSGYDRISPLGQAVATDFIAVYVAEQDRHLMVDMKTHHWDSALLEVTLLGAFHSGQREVMVPFQAPGRREIFLTGTVVNQAPGGEPRTRKRPASLIDYWQFSSNPDPKSKNRSGINVTRRQFTVLERAISDHMRRTQPQLVANVERHLRGVRVGRNVFAHLADFLINARAMNEIRQGGPQSLGAAGPQLASDFVAFLGGVRSQAQAITDAILASRMPLDADGRSTPDLARFQPDDARVQHPDEID